MKLDIYRRILCLRCSIFDSNWIRGHRGWRRETEILENAESGEIGMKLDGKNKHKF